MDKHKNQWLRLERPRNYQPGNNPRLTDLKEGLEAGDLDQLVHDELHIDEYKSKMGNDEDVVVVSFKISGKEPAIDLVNFIEKGYAWVIDADTSSGEMDDGDYIVFIELEREPKVAENLLELFSDLEKLTGIAIDEWRIKYHKSRDIYRATLEDLKKCIPSSPREYIERVSKDRDSLNKLKAAAGVKIDDKAPNNDFTESIRIAAGIL